MNMIGHNGPPAFMFASAADLPDDLPKMHFFKCDIAALRKAIIDKPLDIRGAFLSALLAMYEHMEPLPADDRQAMLRTGIHNTKLWKRVKAELIKLDLVQVTPTGRLTNSRFEDEITSYVTEFRNRQNAAIEREKKAKIARATKAEKPTDKAVTTQLQPANNSLATQLSEPNNSVENGFNSSGVDKKSNNFNDSHTTILPERAPQADHESRIRARVLDLEIDKTREEKNIDRPPETPPVYLRAGGRDEDDIPGLNGATSVIVKQLATWLNSWAPDVPTASRMISNWVKQYGGEAVRDGFAEYEAEMIDGKVRVPSAKSILGFIQRSKIKTDGRQSSTKTGDGKPAETTKQRWERYAAEAKTKGDA